MMLGGRALMSQNRASPRGLRPESSLALSLGLPIRGVLAAPRFALSPILARNARAFDRVSGSRRGLLYPLSYRGFAHDFSAGALKSSRITESYGFVIIIGVYRRPSAAQVIFVFSL
jgi:hypothetical protein